LDDAARTACFLVGVGHAGRRGVWRDFVDVVARPVPARRAAVLGRVGGDHGEAVAGFALKVRVVGEGDRAAVRVDAEQSGIRAGSAVRAAARGDVDAVVSGGVVDQLAGAAGFINGGGHVGGGASRRAVVEVVVRPV